MATILDQLRYPIGHFEKPARYTPERIADYFKVLSEFPDSMKKETAQLSTMQLDTAYRPGGWTIRQVVHHCADSHLNSYIRFKWALTEEKPVIKPYYEDRWAELEDAKNLTIEPSLLLLEGLHFRWVALLKSLTDQQLTKQFIHPDGNKEISLCEAIGLYAWHCQHHLAHITELKKRMGWI